MLKSHERLSYSVKHNLQTNQSHYKPQKSPLQPIEQRQLDEQSLEPPRPEPVAPAQVAETPVQAKTIHTQKVVGYRKLNATLAETHTRTGG